MRDAAPFMASPMMMMRPSGPTLLPQAPQVGVDWDREFSRVGEDVKGKGKARIVELDDTTTTSLEEAFQALSTGDEEAQPQDHMSDFAK